jgi:hypothetical protein
MKLGSKRCIKGLHKNKIDNNIWIGIILMNTLESDEF